MIKLIKWYQLIPGNFHSNCKFCPSCSNYSITAYERFGFFKGSFLTMIRIIKCSPLTKGGIDLVPERKKK